MASSGKASSHSAYLSSKSSPDSSVYSSSSSSKVRSEVCRSASSRVAHPQLFVCGSPAPRCVRRTVLQSTSSAVISDNEVDQPQVHVAWEDPFSLENSFKMNELLINHSPSSLATRLQNTTRRPTPGRHLSARFRTNKNNLPRRVVPRSAPLSKPKIMKQSSVSENSSSSHSLTASSAGDVPNEPPTERSRGPSPLSSISTVSATYSQLANTTPSQTSTTEEGEEEEIQERYSFPVPPLQLRKALEGGLARQSHDSNCSLIARDSQETHPRDELLESKANVSLIDIQEKVIALVESQQACSELTWNAMHQLSAALERLCPSAEIVQPRPQRTALPPPLLLEAAGCARRLANILVQLGEATMQSDCPADHIVSADVVVTVKRPSSDELRQQKSRLRHISKEETSENILPSPLGVAEVLRNVVERRRKSIETVSSRTSISSGAPSCWDI